MGLRGPKPEGKINIEWSANFAYGIGLIVTDGCLSPSGRHILFTSKDMEQIQNFKVAFGIDTKPRIIKSGHKDYEAWRIQFGDVNFYKFLNSIGITKAKSLTIQKVNIPDEYFFDFLRGCFDGDGCFYSYWDTRWKSSFMYYCSLASGSKNFLISMQEKVFEKIGCKGHFSIHKKKGGKNPYYQLKFAKNESNLVLAEMYYTSTVMCLTRKKLKIESALGIVDLSLKKIKNNARVAKLADAIP